MYLHLPANGTAANVTICIPVPTRSTRILPPLMGSRLPCTRSYCHYSLHTVPLTLVHVGPDDLVMGRSSGVIIIAG